MSGRKNIQYRFSSSYKCHKYTVFCHEAALAIGKTTFIHKVFFFLHFYLFQSRNSNPPSIICIKKDSTTWAESSVAHSPRMALNLVQYGGRREVPDSHRAFFGARNQQCACSI